MKMMLRFVWISLLQVGVFMSQKSCYSDWSWWRIKRQNISSGLISLY